MTVVLALRCAEGVVLAADSQATAQLPGAPPTKQEARKINRLGDRVLFAATGAQGVTQRVQYVLGQDTTQFDGTTERMRVAADIQTKVNPLQQSGLKSWVEHQGTQPEAWGAIFCGWDPDGPWIMEIDINGGWQFHDEHPAATGSGLPFVHTAISGVQHYDLETQSLEAAKAIAFRAVENTCLASGFGVSLPVQMGVLTETETMELTGAEITELEDLVNLWRAKEVETLGDLAPRPAVEASEPTGEQTEPGLEQPD